MTQRFTITDDHIKLIRAANITWLGWEYGAPGVDPKCPYGNSAALTDIAQIINPDFKSMREGAALDWLEDNTDRLERLHKETETVLRIGVQTGRFEVGTYAQVGSPYAEQWEREGGE